MDKLSFFIFTQFEAQKKIQKFKVKHLEVVKVGHMGFNIYQSQRQPLVTPLWATERGETLLTTHKTNIHVQLWRLC